MTETAADRAARSPRPRPIAGAVLAALFVGILVAAQAGAPYLFKRTTLQSEVATQVRATTGLAITTEHARFGLLPRPHVSMAGVHLKDPSTALDLEADRIDGDVRLLPLIVGRVELSTFTLARPRVRVDLDSPSFRSDRAAGRAVLPAGEAKGVQRRLGTVAFVDGTVTVVGGSLRHPFVVTGVNTTLDWRDLESAATLTGSLQIATTTVEIAGWIAEPSRMLRGDRSTTAWHIHSAPLDLTASGEIAGGPTSIFKGRVSGSAPVLDGLFDLGTPALPLPAPFAAVAMSGDATIRFDRDRVSTVDLQNFEFRADGNAYEGTLAYQSGARPIVTATLATGQLVLAPFLAGVPRLFEPDGSWAPAKLPPLHVGAVDLDIRISAAHLRLAPLSIDEAALSVMTRGDRLEIGVNEGRAYGGTIKGRVSLGSAADGLDVRAAGSLADADLAPLSWDALGWQAASGAVSASANLETTGDSPATLIAHLQGWAKARAKDGQVFGLDFAAVANGAGHGGTINRIKVLPSGRTPFSDTIVGLHLVDGRAVLDEAVLHGPESALSLGGTSDLAGRTLDLHAIIRPSEAARADPKLPNTKSPDAKSPDTKSPTGLRLSIAGGFDRWRVAPEATAPPPGAPDLHP